MVILSAGGIFMLDADRLRPDADAPVAISSERFAARVRSDPRPGAGGDRQRGRTGCDQYCLDASRRRSGPDDPAHRPAVGAHARRSREHAGDFGPARGERPGGLHRLQDRADRRPAVAVPGARCTMLPFAGMVRTLLPRGRGMVGLLAPDWVIGRRRNEYQAQLDLGLPDALDMMVICAQAGLGLGPTIVRVANELQPAHWEVAAGTGADRQRVADGLRQPDCAHQSRHANRHRRLPAARSPR